MKTVVRVFSGDQIDKHGDKITIEALKDMRDQTNANIYPSFMEHDYRLPPIGRVYKAEIIEKDGSHLLIGEIELFDLDDINKQNPISGKQLVIHQNEINHIQIGFDRSYELNNQIDEIKILQNAIDNEKKPIYEAKKAFEPISCLTLLGAAVLGGLSTGFLNKIGSDIWDKIINVYSKNKKEEQEKQIIINITVNVNGNYIEATINHTNPEITNIKNATKIGIDIIETVLNEYNKKNIPVKKVVINSDKNGIRHEYSVYIDGTPFDIYDLEKYGTFIISARGKI